MRLAVSQVPPKLFPWIVNRLDLSPTANFRALMAYVPEGPILGMVAYDGWTKSSCAIHLAIESPAAIRAFIMGDAPAFRYPFILGGMKVLIGTVRADNAKALKLDRHLGFEEVGRIQDGSDSGVDLIILQLRRENCRWLKEKH